MLNAYKVFLEYLRKIIILFPIVLNCESTCFAILLMQWYGLKSLISKSCTSNISKKNKNFNAKKYLRWKPALNNTNPHSLMFYIPDNWNFVLIKKNSKIKTNYCSFIFYFVGPVYFFLCPLNLFFSNWTWSSNPAVFSMHTVHRSNYVRTFWNRLILIFQSFTKIFFVKLKFKGKGYYIYKNKRNTVALQFNYSHIKRLYIYFTYVKFLSKTSILIYGIDPRELISASNLFIKVRPINIFTGKGVRFNRQIIYRKTGKVSSYR